MNEHDEPKDKAMVTLIGGKPFTTTLVIAEGVGRPHHGVIQLIRQHLADFEKFGLVAFEMRPRLEGQHGGGDIEYAILNEHQGMLALTYMRNSEVVRKFKMNLISAFFALADKVRQLSTQVESKPPVNVSIMAGNFDEKDRPVAVATKFGTAFFNWPTYFMHMTARANPRSEQHVLLTSAMAASKDMLKYLPEPVRTVQKLKMAVLDANPLWSDILHCQRMGLTTATIARVCGCHPSTVRRHLKKMQEAGLFDDPLKGMTREMYDLLLPNMEGA